MKAQKVFDIHYVDALFFDFDGVIADTIDIKTTAFGLIFKEYGKNAVNEMMDYHRNHGGVSRYEKFKYFYTRFLNRRITEKEMRILDRKFSAIVFDKAVKAPFLKGARKFIGIAHKCEKSCFVVSATPGPEIKKIVKAKKLKKYFKEVLGSPNSKVDNLRKLLRKYNLDPEKCFYFGDTESDRRAAVKCKINFVGINCGGGIKGYKHFEEFMNKKAFNQKASLKKRVF